MNCEDYDSDANSKGLLISIEGPYATLAEHTALLVSQELKKGSAPWSGQVQFVQFRNPPGFSLGHSSVLQKPGKPLKDMDPYFHGAILAENHREQSSSLQSRLIDGGIVLTTAYVEGVVLDMGLKFSNAKECSRFASHQFNLEYDCLGLPHPNHVVMLDLSPQGWDELQPRKLQTRGGVGNYGKKDLPYFEEFNQWYHALGKKRNWNFVDCNPPHFSRSESVLVQSLCHLISELIERQPGLVDPSPPKRPGTHPASTLR